MKLFCETCEGEGRLYTDIPCNICPDCNGNGYITPSPIIALKVIKSHCESIEDCNKCEIQKECGDIRFKQVIPARWELGDGNQ